MAERCLTGSCPKQRSAVTLISRSILIVRRMFGRCGTEKTPQWCSCGRQCIAGNGVRPTWATACKSSERDGSHMDSPWTPRRV